MNEWGQDGEQSDASQLGSDDGAPAAEAAAEGCYFAGQLYGEDAELCMGGSYHRCVHQMDGAWAWHDTGRPCAHDGAATAEAESGDAGDATV
jgi:hypothetical protein